ncbi:MAG: hypothetical protein NTY33_04865 [Candidatus Moranbacteria bacterium]|nr:hypothetical protein [Candidatus Moranbacteria bacterium]
MKKLTTVLVCVLAIFSTIIFASLASAEETKWRRVVYDESSDIFKESYALELGKCVCILILTRDGSELCIFSKDYSYHGKFLGQFVKINSIKHTIEKSAWEVRNDKRVNVSANYGYDIFRTKFLPRIGELPPEIRAKFDGQWGIQ